MDNSVFVIKTQTEYPMFPYDDGSDPVYRSLLSLFDAWGRNPENPFGDLVEPGGTVVIKPNWVKHNNPRGSLECLITHSSLIKYVIDFTAKALAGRGRIIVGDAPIQSCDFQKLVELSRIRDVLDLARKKYPDITFELEDWRLTIMHNGSSGSSERRAQTQRDGYDNLVSTDFILIDRGKGSFLEDIADYSDNFRVTAYKTSLMLAHHRAGRHVVTSNGMGPKEMDSISELFNGVLKKVQAKGNADYRLDGSFREERRRQVRDLCRKFPIE